MAMAIWLLKTEPSDYSFSQLMKDKTCVWDGVANNTAQMHMRSAKKGDTAIIYHTGDERSAVGLAVVTGPPVADTTSDNPKYVALPLGKPKALGRPVSLAQIKADPAFAGWDLIRLGRLSAVPTTEAQLAHLLKLAGND
jgi:predicted RNA-binding protein with PUA-like domain